MHAVTKIGHDHSGSLFYHCGHDSCHMWVLMQHYCRYNPDVCVHKRACTPALAVTQKEQKLAWLFLQCIKDD